MKKHSLCIATTYLATCLISGLLFAPSQLLADTDSDVSPDENVESSLANSEPNEIETIIVTARLRDENLQDVPASISAISGDVTERARIQTITDIALIAPGMTFVSLQGSNYALPVVRGLSTNVGEPNVGFFVDGVYLGSRSGMDRLLPDIERIEIARGPQVALYGRNTFAGAVSIITRQPSNEFEGVATATLGSSSLFETSANLSGPLIEDQLFARISAAHQERDGFYTNELTGGHIDDRETQMYTGSLRWLPTPDLSFDLRAQVEKTDNGDNPGYFTLNNSEPPFRGRSQILMGEVPPKTEGFAVTPGGFKRDSDILSLRADWQIHERMKFTSITSYYDLSSQFDLDNDYGPAEISFLTQDNDTEEFSQEVRVMADGDSVSWLLGAFYLETKQRTHEIDLVNTAYENLLPASLRSAEIDNHERTENSALFGSLDYRFAEDWEWTVAARVFREKKAINPFQQNPYSGAVLEPNPDLSMTDTHFTPSTSLKWHYADGRMAYGSITRAAKSGGFNALANVTPDERTFDSETSWNYELGLRSTWMDRRLMLNGALFYIEWDDQIVRALGVNGATLNANAGKTRSQGVELESRLRATDDLTFSFSYAYTDAYFREYVFEALALAFGLEADLAGNELQYVSPHVGTFAIDFDRPLSNGWYLVARTDLSYRSRQFGTTTNHYWVDDSTRVSAMFGFHKDHFEIDVWAKNLFDDDTPTVSISQRDRSSVILPPPGQGVFKTLAFAPDPRAWGVTARIRF